MSNPRDRIGINRPLAPPPATALPTATPTVVVEATQARRPTRAPTKKTTAEPRLLGKRQGNMRCIGLYLPHDAQRRLDDAAEYTDAPPSIDPKRSTSWSPTTKPAPSAESSRPPDGESRSTPPTCSSND